MYRMTAIALIAIAASTTATAHAIGFQPWSEPRAEQERPESGQPGVTARPYYYEELPAVRDEQARTAPQSEVVVEPWYAPARDRS